MAAKTTTQKKEKKKISFFQEIRKNKVLYLMLVPAMAFVLLFAYIPLVGIYYAFINYNYIDGLFGSPFVGMKNFEYLFKGGFSSPVWALTRNTLLYNIVFIFLGNILQVVIAILLTEIMSKWFKKVSQTVILLPYFVSYVIVGTIAYNMFNVEFGSINSLIKFLGGEPINLYAMPKVWPAIIILFFLWKGLGYGTVIYLAAIMGIDRELYDAARTDGCNIFQEIRYITMPMLKNTFVTLILFALGGIMRGQFDLFFQLVGNNGQLFPYTDIIDTYIYRALTINFNLGTSTAAGVYQSVFGLVLVLAVNHIVKKISPDSALF